MIQTSFRPNGSKPVVTNQERLDKLQRSKRLQTIVGVLAIAILLLIASLFYFVFHVPGETREVTGTIVSFETRKSDDAMRFGYFIYVRLGSGPTVRATIGAHVPIKIGRRVTLIATQMPILGIERYRFKAFIEEPPGDDYLFPKRSR